MNFEEYKEERLLKLKKINAFYSSSNKTERERWVVREFLKNMQIKYDEEELLGSEDTFPDILFRNAKFEIKELMDDDRRRHYEVKQEYEVLERAKSYDDVPREEWDIEELSLEEFFDWIVRKLVKEKQYPDDVVANTDLLIYVNTIKSDIDREKLIAVTPRNAELRKWRSLSFLFNDNSACVLFASDSAPNFIKDSVGKLSFSL
ncbi:MAG: DUF1780 domain-containing protein [Deltaproteobacteria bacterium]|nr:DUF1780 domain-containing protein [Deltaproteobacteria bacterium]